MVGCKFYIENQSDWVNTLLQSEFFGSCVHHQHLKKNEKNVFCIDCNSGFCKHCTKAHYLHRQLQICRYVYQDVVRLQDIQKYLDCSKIQTYKINGEKAVHLHQKPPLKDSKPSTKAKFGGSCEACRRYLQDLPNKFCSIACKVSTVPLKPKDKKPLISTFSIHEFPNISWKQNYNQEKESSGEMESSLSVTEISEVNQEWMMFSALRPRKQLRKRKGIPRRSPLC